MMKVNTSILLIVFTFLTGCGGTGKFVNQPQLSIVGADTTTVMPEEAVEQLFGGNILPFRISFCEADPASKTCPDEDSNPSASGIGGIFLPLVMELRAIEIDELMVNDEKIMFEARLDSPVNQIPPACGTVEGVLDTPSAESATLKISNFFCNWAAIGNVVTNITLSIDSINLETNVFTGYYKITFYGTGNASGSGYYRATVGSLDETATTQIGELESE